MNYNEAEVYYSLLPLIIILEIVVISFSYFAITWEKRKKSEETLSRLHKSFIGIFFIEFWYWISRPALNFFKLIKTTPNKITAISIFLSFITGAIYSMGFIALGGWILVVSGTLDMLDGALARETGQTTKSGAFFDSCGDRYSDSFVFIGIALYFLSKNFSAATGNFSLTASDYLGVIVMMTLLLGTATMSYVKARGDVVGASTKRGLMQRPERIMMLTIFSVIDPFIRIILKKYELNQDAGLISILIIMSVLINFSAITRMVSLFRIIKDKEN
jgi:phosphatidylglycerophosphate synthase